MSDLEKEFSISEFQKLNEYVSSSGESGATEDNSSDSAPPKDEPSNSVEELTSDEEVEVDLNNLGSLVKETDNKPQTKQFKDIDSLFTSTKLKLKKENELNNARKQRTDRLMKHLEKFNKKQKDEPVEEVTFKEWHVPLMEVPTKGNFSFTFDCLDPEPKSKKRKT